MIVMFKNLLHTFRRHKQFVTTLTEQTLLMDIEFNDLYLAIKSKNEIKQIQLNEVLKLKLQIKRHVTILFLV